MESVSISELKARLSSYLVQVRSGAEVLVTDRGHPVARLVPYFAPASDARRLERMAAEGLLRLPRHPMPPELSAEEPAGPTGLSLVDALLEEREDGR